MAHPVGKPGMAPTTPFGRRGRYWSCLRNAYGGIHTGADWSWTGCHGAPVYAVVDGHVRRRNYGAAFGSKQIAISPDSSGEWFYAHLSAIYHVNEWVEAGTMIGRIGNEGNSTAPHLHLEWKNTKQRWFCGDHKDPWPEIQRLEPQNDKSYPKPSSGKVYLSKLKFGQADSDSVWYLQRALGMPRALRTAYYGPLTDEAVREHQAANVPPADAPGKSFVGPKQADILFGDSQSIRVINDLPKEEGPEPGPEEFSFTALTFNIPARYKAGGTEADVALIKHLMTQCDILGLQEAGWLKKHLVGLGWEIHHPRDSTGGTTSNLLLWNPKVFEMVDRGNTMLSPKTPIQREAAGPTNHREKHIVWADLKHRKTGEIVYAACVHMVPSKHLGGAAGALWDRQAATLESWIKRQGDVCFVVGDFNCKHTDPDAANLRKIAKISSARSHGLREIDWVLTKKNSRVSAAKGVALDNRKQSDHKPVKAKITVKVDKKPEKPAPDWKPSEAGQQLFAQVNKLWPNRDKRTDGTIGDLAHCGPGAPPSEHCPDPATGYVRAVDIDADLGPKGESQRLADAIVQAGKAGDKRLWYVIHNGRIRSVTYGWEDRPYNGSNPHTSHIHVSFKPSGDKDGSPFDLSGLKEEEGSSVTREEFDALSKRVDELSEKVGAFGKKSSEVAALLDEVNKVLTSK
jgi:endonuclease/exonuclease/phosphatase family metal-dependent hydrolase